MNETDLNKLSKTDLIKIILQLKANHPRIYKPRPPKPTPRRSVRDMVKDYEENIIQPPLEFRDDYKPVKPIPESRTKINEIDKALKGYTKSYEIVIKNNKDPLEQLQNTRLNVKHHINTLLNKMKGLKFVEALKVTFSKMIGDVIIYKTAYFNSKAQIIINEEEIAESLKISEQQILNFVSQFDI